MSGEPTTAADFRTALDDVRRELLIPDGVGRESLARTIQEWLNDPQTMKHELATAAALRNAADACVERIRAEAVAAERSRVTAIAIPAIGDFADLTAEKAKSGAD